ncbi:hypothetical protein [Rhodoferax sp.]|uniref:hypothetical protein n=1 Tax=Rhodoferax sp. TaxID=50421 RepID=UPI0025F598A4|nr:hypothetical protein [Rhodoferax sp.]MCM2340110.1 hypothetical protein [Rhodoferax sp.]
MFLKKSIMIFVTFIVTACAQQQILLKQTSSGYPEGVFKNTNVESIRSKLLDACSIRGYLVHEATGNQVVCGKTMSGTEAVFAQMLVGNSYSTTPEQRIKFIVYQSGSNVKVTANQWIESQMAMGQVRRQELNSNNQNNSIQQLLFSMGAE